MQTILKSYVNGYIFLTTAAALPIFISSSCTPRQKNAGMGSISCLSPLCPDRFDALLLPERGVGFVAASAMDIAEPYRHVRLDALIQTEPLQKHGAS